MKLENRDLTETEKTRLVWVITYAMAASTILFRTIHTWEIVHTPPFSWWRSAFGCFNLLFCLFPLLFGIAIRRSLKRDLNRDQLSPRAYQLYGYLIAMLVYFAYMAMVLYEQPRGW